MTQVTPHPVDSTYHPCCNAIGGHSRDCTTAVPVPPGVTETGAFDPDETTRAVVAVLGAETTVPVQVYAEQRRDGTLGCMDITVEQAAAENGYNPSQARLVAALLVAAADLAERWAMWTPA